MRGSIRKRGNNWYYYFDVAKSDGKRRRIERKGGKTRKEAERALNLAINEYENAGVVFSQTNISVSDYMDYWLKEYVELNCRYTTKERYKVMIEKHIKPSIGFYRLSYIQPATLQKLINEKYLSGLSRQYLQNISALLSSAFKMAVFPFKFIKENPMQYVKLPKASKVNNEIQIISQNDFKKILDRFPEGSSFYIPLLIAFHTGIRISECCALTWDDINFTKKTISINKILIKKYNHQWHLSEPKTTSSTRDILVGETLIEILSKHLKWQKANKLKLGNTYKQQFCTKENRIYQIDNCNEIQTLDKKTNFVCTDKNGSLITSESFRYCSRVINYELGIPFHYHMLRHTHATMLIENGAKIKDVQERLGHSKITTTMNIYTHSTDKMAKETVNIFEKALKRSKLME